MAEVWIALQTDHYLAAPRDHSRNRWMLGDSHRRIERFLNAPFTVATDAKGRPLTTSSTLL